MRQNDARQLSHDMLEDMRRRAVMAVQEGQSPEAVGKAFGLNRTTIYDWLAEYRRGGWGGVKGKPLAGRPPNAITSKGHMRFMVKDKGGVNSDTFIEFLKRLLVGAKRTIFLIVDRGPAHVSKKTKAFVETLGRR